MKGQKPSPMLFGTVARQAADAFNDYYAACLAEQQAWSNRYDPDPAISRMWNMIHKACVVNVQRARAHWERLYRQKHMLFVNLSDSRCGNCGRGADPYEKSHTTLLGYGVKAGETGCGIEWQYIASDYVGCHADEWAARERPDLEWVQMWPVP
jgi:hypothetical protein